MTEIRRAAECDRDFWFSLDAHISREEFIKKVRDGQGYILFDDNAPKAILRYNLFWDNLPFCTLVSVERSVQKKGYGRLLMEHWEKEMRSLGYGMVLTSTQVDEYAQHFYRKLGYKDCGALIIDIKGYEQPMEMFLCKAL